MAVDRLGPWLHSYLSCAVNALDPKPARQFVAPGSEVAWDDCCGGQVWVRVLRLTPIVSLSPRKASGEQCGPDFFDVTVGMGVVRCLSTLDDEGNAPPAAAVTSDADRMTADMAALLEAITCCIGGGASILAWEPLGPQGGCGGGEWTFTVRLPGCNCPD